MSDSTPHPDAAAAGGGHPARLVRALEAHLAFNYDHRPACTLDIVAAPQAADALARDLAGRCFGDPGLVYDVTRRLAEPGIVEVGVALGGASPGYAAPPGESLAHFIATRQRGVIAFDDLQAFPDRAIGTIAEITDSGRACAEGSASPTLPAENFVVLAFARLALPSPRALARSAGLASPWQAADEVPSSFVGAIESIARTRYPEHFSRSVVGRFGGIDAGFAWDRCCELVARGELDTPIFDSPTGLPRLASPAQPAARELVDDVRAIAPAAVQPFDVFISYSWTRTADDAAWLRERLRARGLRVFFDKDHLDVSRVGEEEVKPLLIAQLSATVAAARSWIVFAAELKPYYLPQGIDRAEALRRGLAMELEESHDELVAWNWQRLEMRHMGRRLIVGRTRAYVVSGDGQVDEGFGIRDVPTRDDVALQVDRYLDSQGLPDDGDAAAGHDR
jgi:hypothetical protein